MSDLADLLLVVNVVLAAVIVTTFVDMTVNRPAVYLWLYMTKPWLYVVTFCSVQFSCVMLVARAAGNDSSIIGRLVPSIIVTAFLAWFFNYQHNRSGYYFSKDVAEYLPGSCPVCALYRAGAFYKFIKPGQPIPDHPECEEK